MKDKVFEHRPISELFAIVKNDFRKFDNEGLIDEGTLIKTVMYCNDKLGILVHELRETGLSVFEYKAELPLDFEKLYYVCAIGPTNTLIHETRNPWDNNFDQDIIYDAHLDKESLGCVDNYQVVIKRQTNTTVHSYGTWVQLDVAPSSQDKCHIDSPNKRRKGTYTVEIKDGYLDVPFRAGTLYMIYIGMMKDVQGNITFPFHPLITPYYEWMLKEKVLQDAIFNSDQANLGELLKYASEERKKAWLDAFNFTSDSSYGQWAQSQRKKELGWYSEWFRYFK